jgi:ankyrin repeat protein
MATLWHVGDVIELICEFDDCPTHLTTLRRISWSFHRAVENMWTLLLGRQNTEMGDEQLNSIAHRYVNGMVLLVAGVLTGPTILHASLHDTMIRALRAALTALRHTVTAIALPWQWMGADVAEVVRDIVGMPQLQSAKFLGREKLHTLSAQLGTPAQLEALLHRCPQLFDVPVDWKNPPALHCTARSGNVECALVLLLHGCDPHVKNLDGSTIAHIAAEHGHHAYLAAIIDAGYDVGLSFPNHNGETAVHRALKHPSTLRFLIDRGVSVDTMSTTATPAHWAAMAGMTESLRILIAAGANLESTTAQGLTVTMMASDHPACLDVLCDAGANLGAVGPDGRTVVHFAASAGQLESLRTLHRRGADMFAVSAKGETPERLAALGSFAECCKYFRSCPGGAIQPAATRGKHRRKLA